MGWSCRKDAMDTLEAVQAKFAIGKSANILTLGGEDYFFEIGRENADGSITGTVHKMLPGGYCRKAGSFKIGGDGEIVRFPGLTKAQREDVMNLVAQSKSKPYLIEQLRSKNRIAAILAS